MIGLYFFQGFLRLGFCHLMNFEIVGLFCIMDSLRLAGGYWFKGKRYLVGILENLCN